MDILSPTRAWSGFSLYASHDDYRVQAGLSLSSHEQEACFSSAKKRPTLEVRRRLRIPGYFDDLKFLWFSNEASHALKILDVRNFWASDWCRVCHRESTWVIAQCLKISRYLTPTVLERGVVNQKFLELPRALRWDLEGNSRSDSVRRLSVCSCERSRISQSIRGHLPHQR